MRRMILDVDTGVDDAIAIALAVSSGIELVGISTVAGNVPVDTATRNTLDVLSYLGRSDIEVHRGASRPLSASYQDATHIHGGNGLGGFQLPQSKVTEVAPPGPAFLIESALRYGDDLTVVTLGPLTNLAIALNVRPEIAHLIGRMVVMGGAYQSAGNVTPHAEFNVYVDPDAAHQVFNAPWKDLTLVGLDVTHQTTFSRETWDLVDPESSAVASLVWGVMERTFTERDMSGFFLHDPLAVAVGIDRSLVSGTSRSVSVVASGDGRGKTVLAGDLKSSLVATRVDAERFIRELGEALGIPSADHMAGLSRSE